MQILINRLLCSIGDILVITMVDFRLSRGFVDSLAEDVLKVDDKQAILNLFLHGLPVIVDL